MTDHHDSEEPAPVVRVLVTEPLKAWIAEILGFIGQQRERTRGATNQELVELYWNLREHLSRRTLEA